MFLCRFRKLDFGSQDSIRYLSNEIVDRSIYFQDPKLLNDPYECFPRFEIGRSAEELARTRRYLIDHVPEGKLREAGMPVHLYVDRVLETMQAKGAVEMAMNYRETLTRRGICCFTSDPRSILMWAHYGWGHHGVCLIYELDDELRRRKHLGQVRYEDDPAVIRLHAYDPESDVNPHEEWGNVSLLTKYKKWGYEKEWRLFSKRVGPMFGDSLKGVKLWGVIRGAAMTEHEKTELRKLVARNPVPVRDATLDYSRFQVNIRNIPI